MVANEGVFQVADAPMYGYVYTLPGLRTPRYAEMGAAVGVFQVADAPTNSYIYTLPGLRPVLGLFVVIVRLVQANYLVVCWSGMTLKNDKRC